MKNLFDDSEKFTEFNGEKVKVTKTKNGYNLEVIKPNIFCTYYECKSNTPNKRYKVQLTKDVATKYERKAFVCHVADEKTAKSLVQQFNQMFNLLENK
jgi:hypothetical protein